MSSQEVIRLLDTIRVALGGGAAASTKAEDAAHASADIGFPSLAVRTDTPTNRSGTDGDYEFLQISAGRLWASSLITGDALTALQLIDDTVFADDAAFTIATSKVMAAGFLADETAADSVDEGDIGIPRMTLDRRVRTAESLYNGTGWDNAVKSNATSRIVSAAASNNATSAKASAGELHATTGYNAAAATRYLKFYNKASAPTVGTDTPVLTIALPPTAAFHLTYPNGGHYFSTGLAYALVTGSADSDNTAVTAADILGLNVVYS